MARPREFKEEDALDGAIDAFWKNGYGATNLPDLLDAMGLTRGSFYAAFTDKHKTYLAALERYENVHLPPLLQKLLEPSNTALEERLLILYEQIDTTGPLNQRRGCFICNAMIEFGTADHLVAKSALRMSNAIENTLFTVLVDAGKDATIAKSQAQALLQLYYGAQALSKAGNGTTDFLTTIKAIISQ